MPTENRSSTELSKIVTEALVGMVTAVTGMKPPTDEPLPGFIQAPIDRAVTRISGLLAQPAEQHQGEPVACVKVDFLPEGARGHLVWFTPSSFAPGQEVSLYTHADPNVRWKSVADEQVRVIENLREGIAKHWKVVCDQRAKLAERDALLGPIAGWTAETRAAVLEAFQDELNESASYPWYDAAIADLMKIIEGIPASAYPSAPYSATHYYPAAAPDRKWRKQVGGLWCEFCGGKWLPLDEQGMSHEYVAIEPSAPVERDEREQCAICRDLGRQCMECEEAEFREWADRYFAATDYRKTDAGMFIRDWMRHAYAAWCARAALERKP